MVQSFITVVIASILCATLSVEVVVASTHWSYSHIEKWPGVCSTGKLQSPINLLQKASTEKSFNAFQFNNYDKSYPVTMKNNKHSVEVRFKQLTGLPSVKGGSLPSEFILDHMHFHWESEHTIDGKRYPLELHLVHYDARHGNISEAKKMKDGLAVLGVLFNISPDDDTDMQQLVEIIDNIGKYPDKIVDLKDEVIPKNFLPCDTAGFYRYEGSLTTPGCDEVVIWTVFTNKQTLSTKQVKEFESIHCDEGPLLKNYRPIQPLNGRRLQLKVSPINAATSLITTPTISLILSFITAYFTYSY